MMIVSEQLHVRHGMDMKEENISLMFDVRNVKLLIREDLFCFSN